MPESTAPGVRRPVVELMDPMMVEILRAKTPAQRLEISFGMWETARVILRGSIQQQHPDWTEAMVQHELARRISHGAVDPGKLAQAPRESDARN